MTNPIPQAAIEAAAEGIYERAFRQELPEAPIDLARAALEAAIPEIRKQIASEIRANEGDWIPHMYYTEGREDAARIAEKGTEK